MSSYIRPLLYLSLWERLREWFPTGEGYSITSMSERHTDGMMYYYTTVTRDGSDLTFTIVSGEHSPLGENPHMDLLLDTVRRPSNTAIMGRENGLIHPWGATVIEDALTIYRIILNNLHDPHFPFEEEPDADPPLAIQYIKRDFDDTMPTRVWSLSNSEDETLPGPQVNGFRDSDDDSSDSAATVATIPLAEYNNRREAPRTNGTFV
ncbi:hypothetical protein ASPBRDRAFT_31258 [Aspergillus brasiliensis CBS 101740]|uniref:Uncharacterized protein n=1 Tax=Aspergillus brasiliensis (strain CBS 101740 / IMI 381727 / IBT 21946) TaxID=767769 RepID=A0A1L9UFB7_ASPBC|nr:hypothetical protein ASPBRDRAFT_31258 [Aspergillus brasiliensis CBS 101740]